MVGEGQQAGGKGEGVDAPGGGRGAGEGVEHLQFPQPPHPRALKK